MPKEKKPGWKYFYSEYFKEEFAIHEASGWVYFEKGARYSPEEFILLEKSGKQMDIESHRLKTIIGGEIVGYEQKGTNSITADPNLGDKVPKAGKISIVDADGDYFIF